MSNPLSMRDTAIAVHELFKSFCDAGFNEEQALRLVETMMKNGKVE